MRGVDRWAVALILAFLALFLGPPSRMSMLVGEVDGTRYMSPDELQPGMKGHGRTIMSGTKIETFNVEIISVMRNAFYAKQDVILARCSGLNLEHTGIIGGMSGSPCYIKDASGRDRMIGAVAYGWSMNKDPICGIQPITQMLPIPGVRDPQKRPKPIVPTLGDSSSSASSVSGRGIPLGELMARSFSEPIDASSRFSVFNDEIRAHARPAVRSSGVSDQLRPLLMPIMVSGASERTFARLRARFEPMGFTLVASGGPSTAAASAPSADQVVLEPGSALCIPIMTGDMMMEALGTCTEVIGNKVLGFGHSMSSTGFTELPLATGMIHTVIPSVARSNKLGAALRTVGTLWGDESSGVFGVVGDMPKTTPLEVTVNDVRGRQVFKYNVVRERDYAASALVSGVEESIFSHSGLPEEHVVKYSVAVEFEGLGTFKTANFTSMVGTASMVSDILVPVMTLTNTSFGQLKVAKVKVDVNIEAGAKAARMERAQLVRTNFKPGEKVTVRVRWFHLFQQPAYTESSYDLELPRELPNGEYQLVVGSVQGHLAALRTEKPQLWRAENLSEALKVINLTATFQDDRFYMHLTLPDNGVAIGRTEMPELPTFRQQIVADARRIDVQPFTEALTVQHEAGFQVQGSQVFRIRVGRKNEY